MAMTPADDRIAADVSAAEVDGPGPGGADLKQASDRVGQRVDGGACRWARSHAPAVAAGVVAALALLIVGVRLRRRRTGAGVGPRLSDNPKTYRVYATREGLVGRKTANGHVITARDHFVALPSRRALSPKGGNQYSVRVCADNGRCETAPVWDVGPWNTRDDYWNPPAIRQNWTDLPQGKPEAQAAHESRYNGGKDQFGRKVTNPAGIDLADGTFWGGLGLTNNAWVTVTYLWT
jgi:hypothetical protein